jgi:hypothetical protein
VVLVVGGVPISDCVDREVRDADDSEAERSASDAVFDPSDPCRLLERSVRDREGPG